MVVCPCGAFLSIGIFAKCMPSSDADKMTSADHLLLKEAASTTQSCYVKGVISSCTRRNIGFVPSSAGESWQSKLFRECRDGFLCTRSRC